MCAQPQPASRAPRRRQSWRHPAALALFAWAALALLPPPAAAQTPTVTITRDADDHRFSEAGSGAAITAIFNIAISEAPAGDVTVPYTLSGVDVTDITATVLTGSVTFTPRTSSPVTLTITAVNDTAAEGSEILTVRLDTPSAGAAYRLGGQNSAQAELIDNDSIQAQLGTITPNVTVEGRDMNVGIIIQQNGGIASTVTSDIDITYEIRGFGDTVLNEEDFESLPGTQAPDQSNAFRRTFVISEADAKKRTLHSVTIKTEDDTEVERRESFSLSLVAAASQGTDPVELANSFSGAGVVLQSTQFSIEDNDVTLSVTGPSSEVTEGGTATFTIGRSVATRTQVTVPYTVSGLEVGAFRHPGESTPSTSLSGSFVIPANQSSGDLVLTVLDNAVFEQMPRTLTVTLSAAVSLAIPGGTPPPVTRGAVSFRSGEDGTPQSSAQATILDEEVVEVSAAVQPGSVVAIEGGEIALDFTFVIPDLPTSQQPVVPAPIVVPYSIAFSTTGPGLTPGDFRANDGATDCFTRADQLSAFRFTPDQIRTASRSSSGVPTLQRALIPCADTEIEKDEQVDITISAPRFDPTTTAGALRLAGAAQTLRLTSTLVDDDVALFITGPSSKEVVEGDTAIFTIHRTEATGAAVFVPYVVQGDGNTDLDPPETPLSGSVTILANELSVDLNFTIRADGSTNEANKTLRVALGVSRPAQIVHALPLPNGRFDPFPAGTHTVTANPSSAEVTILGDDVVLIEVSLVGADGRPAATVDVTEGSPFSLAFRLRADPPPPGRITVAFAPEGEGVSDSDFRIAGPDGLGCIVDSAAAAPLLFVGGFDPGGRAFSAGSTSSYPTCDDDRSEENEQVSLRFLEPEVQASPDAVRPSVRYRTADGIVPTFSLTGLTLIDNDAIGVSIADASRREDDSLLSPVEGDRVARFVITATRAPPADITGTYSTEDGTAIAGSDYQAASRPFKIKARELQTTISVNLVDDIIVEEDGETFAVVLSDLEGGGGAGVSLRRSRATATLAENDVRVAIRAPENALVSEGGEAVFTIDRLAGGLRHEVRIDYVVVTNPPGIKLDYSHPTPPPFPDAPTRSSVVLPAGKREVPFSLSILNDGDPEGTERLRVSLTGGTATGNPKTDPPDGTSAVVGAVIVDTRNPDGTNSHAEVTIRPSDSADGSVVLILERLDKSGTSIVPGGGAVEETSPTDPERGGTARYRVRLEGETPSGPVPVSWQVRGVSGGGASAAEADFGGAFPESSQDLVLTAVGVSGAETFDVTVAIDGEPEGDELFAVRATTGAADVVKPAPVTTTITDDDVGVGVGSAQSFVPEGEAATFTFTRAGALNRDVTVVYSVSGVESADFDDPQGGQVVIPSGQSSAVVVLAIIEDGVTEDDETLKLTIDEVQVDGPGAGEITAGAESATVVISQLVVTAALSGPEQVQEGAVARFAVSLAVEPAGRATTEEVVLAYTLGLSGDSATREADYEAPPGGSGTLRIPAGEVAGTIEVPVLRDRVREGEEEFSLALVPERSSGGGGAIRFAATRQTVRILDLTDEEEARREQRTRALLAATGRAAAHMATDVITARMSRDTPRAQAPAGAHRESPGTVAAADGTATLPAGVVAAAAASADREVGARSEGQLGTQSDTDSAGDAATALATDALSTALRLTGLSPGSATPVGADGTALQPDAALFAGIDAPVGAVATGPTAPGSDDAQPGAAAAGELRDSGPRLPRFAELLRGVDFELRGSELGWDRLGEGLGIWGAGTFTSLEGDPDVGGGRLDYEGESYGLFVGADQRLELGAADAGRELLVGAALGWTRADLDYRDRPLQGFAVKGRFRSELLAIHPYASLRLSPRARLWFLAGYGGGDVEIEERDGPDGGDARRRVETDATMWMVSAGAEGDVPLPGLGPASQLLVRVFGTRTSGSLDRARFDDGQLLRGTRARTWRVAGELEGGHRFAFAEGAHFRPFVTARLRGDAGDDLGDDWEFSVDLGGGAELAWPERGLSLGLRGTAQLNQGARHREHRVVVDLRYDLAGDGRGLTVEVENTLEGSGRLGARAEPGLGAAFSPGSYGGGGSLGALLQETTGEDLDAGAASALRHSIRGEIGYGLVAALPSWTRGADGRGRGLLTPYARFDLAAGSQATAAGLRFEAPGGTRLGVEAGVDFHRRRGHTDTAATTSPVYQFLLTGELEF